MLTGAGFAKDDAEARAMLERTIADGSALEKLAQMVEAQYGDPRAVYDTSMLPASPVRIEAPSDRGGFVAHIEAEDVGLVSMHLGGGRLTKESDIDLSVGVVLKKKVGDRVEPGESLAEIHAPNAEKAAAAAEMLKSCYSFSDEPVAKAPFIKGVVR